MQDLDRYISEVLEKKAHSSKSKLTPYKQQILKMRTTGLTYAEIQEYLSRCGVNVTIPAIRYQCNKLLKVSSSAEQSAPLRVPDRSVPEKKTTISKTPPTRENKSSNAGWKKPEWATVDVDIDKYI